MKRLNVLMGDRIVGQLLAQEGAHYFSFDESFIKAPLPLSPLLSLLPSTSPLAPSCRTFSNVSALVQLLSKGTIEGTFQNVCLPNHTFRHTFGRKPA